MVSKQDIPHSDVMATQVKFLADHDGLFSVLHTMDEDEEVMRCDKPALLKFVAENQDLIVGQIQGNYTTCDIISSHFYSGNIVRSHLRLQSILGFNNSSLNESRFL